MLLTPNTLLQNGRYRILRRIGQGGMGAVYEALDTRLNNRVAVKQALVSDPTSRHAFEGEALRLARLHHPALPNVSDHFMEGNGQFLVMRFIDGPDLAEQLEQRGTPFPVELVLAWADDLLDALTYLHSQNPPLIHRDIKPANLKVTKDGHVILLDFGMAKGGLTQVSPMGTMPGYTLGYASYEQMVGQPTDARSDLYGLAATLYTLMTGHVPSNAIVRMNEQFKGQPDPLLPANELNPQIPLYVAELLTQALALNPNERPTSAPVMQAMLKGVPPVSGKPFASAPEAGFAPPTLPQHPPVIRPDLSATTRINPDLQPPPLGGQMDRTRINPDLHSPPVGAQKRETRILPETEQESLTAPPPPAPPRAPVDKEESMRWRLWGILAILLLLIMCGFGFFLSNRTTPAEEAGISNPPTLPASAQALTQVPTSEPTEAPIVEVIPNPTEEPIIPNEPTEEATITPSPTEEATLTPSPTEEATLTPPPAALRLGNGPDLHAARRTFDINLDGIMSEWGGAAPAAINNVVYQPENWSGANDLSGVVYAAWDEQYLYLAIRVTDDNIVQESQDRLLHRGDAVELFWDIDLAGDFAQESYNDDDAQMVFSPGNVDSQPSAWVHFSPTGNFRDQIVVAALLSLEGYEIEVRIPWSGMGIVPQSGQVYGYAVALSDDDSFGQGDQETQMSTSPQLPYPNPHHWGNFFLDP